MELWERVRKLRAGGGGGQNILEIGLIISHITSGRHIKVEMG